MPTFATGRGRPLPLGVASTPDGHNFALLCRHGTRVTLVILPEDGGKVPLAEFSLHPRHNRTGDHWHIRVAELPPTFCFGWCVDGPRTRSTRFDPSRLLFDPACTMLSDGSGWASTCELDPSRTHRRSLWHRGPRYYWEDDAPPLIPLEDSVIYEVHVRGFTCHPSSKVEHPGTYRGLTEKIPYLKWLGVTTVELMPVFEFDECECPFTNPETGEKLVNFWGYNPIAFAAVKAAFAATAGEHGQNQRVPRHGEGAARRGHRSHSRRGLQPHRRRGRSRPHLLLPRARQRTLLPARRFRPLFELHRVRQHRELQPPGRPRPAS